MNNNLAVTGPAMSTTTHNGTDFATELSENVVYHQQEQLSDHEMTVSITNKDLDTHPTEELWQHNTLPTSNNNDTEIKTLAFQQEETMYLKVLRAKEKAWGPNHPTTLDTVEKLGEFYANYGKMQEAESMYSRVLQTSETYTDEHCLRH